MYMDGGELSAKMGGSPQHCHFGSLVEHMILRGFYTVRTVDFVLREPPIFFENYTSILFQ
jgi:hypothetical protein